MRKINSTNLQNILLIILGILVILLSIVNLVKEASNTKEDALNLEEECLLEDGNWLMAYNECEGISQEKCEELGGVFQDCASACRHQESEFCIEVCVQVCSF